MKKKFKYASLALVHRRIDPTTIQAASTRRRKSPTSAALRPPFRLHSVLRGDPQATNDTRRLVVLFTQFHQTRVILFTGFTKYGWFFVLSFTKLGDKWVLRGSAYCWDIGLGKEVDEALASVEKRRKSLT